MSLVVKLMEQLSCDKAAATFLLEASNNDYDVAVNLHLDSAGPTSLGQADGGGAAALEDEVRAPIPPKFEVLCPDPIPGIRFLQRSRGVSAGAAGSSSLNSISTAAFRDFEQETRAQEALMGIGASGAFGNRTSRRRAPPSLDDDQSDTDTTEEERVRLEAKRAKDLEHRRKLEELFRPPLDLIFKGSFFLAREHGWELGQWLLVNIQDDLDFQCYTLNRDVWSNPNVRKLIENTFVLWQASNLSEHGRKYMQFYPNVTMPYIAIIDSSTGELMETFNKSDPREFCLFLKDFIKRRGRLPQRHSARAASNGSCSSNPAGDAGIYNDEVGNSSGRTAGAEGKGEESFINGSSNTKRKGSKRPAAPHSRSPSPLNSSTFKRTRMEVGGEVSPPSRSSPTSQFAPSQLLDITEEDQLKLAIAESLKLSQAVSNHDDDEDASVESLDTFPQDNSEDEGEVNYSFEETSGAAGGGGPSSTTPPKAVSKEEEATPSSSSEEAAAVAKKSHQSEWKTAKGCLSNGAALGGAFDGLSRIPAPTVASGGSSSGTRSKHGPKKDDNSKATDRGASAPPSEDKDSWKTLASDYNGDSIALRVIFPDGERETLQLPSDAPLKVVQVFLRPRGYSSPGHRALSGYPRRDLFSLARDTSLKDAGLAARETLLIERE